MNWRRLIVALEAQTRNGSNRPRCSEGLMKPLDVRSKADMCSAHGNVCYGQVHSSPYAREQEAVEGLGSRCHALGLRRRTSALRCENSTRAPSSDMRWSASPPLLLPDHALPGLEPALDHWLVF